MAQKSDKRGQDRLGSRHLTISSWVNLGNRLQFTHLQRGKVWRRECGDR